METSCKLPSYSLNTFQNPYTFYKEENSVLLTQYQFLHFPMSKPQKIRTLSVSFFSEAFIFLAGNLSALLLWSAWSYIVNPNPNSNPVPISTTTTDVLLAGGNFNLRYDPLNTTFYDEKNLSYSIETPMQDWDGKRKQWLEQHPSFAGGEERVVMLTGSQPSPCPNPIGDHLLLRFFKNKVDYCRIHGYDIFYNNALLHPKMGAFWAKLPVVRAAMIAHPEAEWIWWVDADAAFTDMEFKIPLERYAKYNLVVNGWAEMIFVKKSWIGLNAGVFLMRNCQWSMNFMDTWANMGPMSKDFAKWGEILKSTLSDKAFAEADDQSALVYLMLDQKKKWAKYIYLETEFALHGYWEGIVKTYENITKNYVEIEKKVPGLGRKHAEKVAEYYGATREKYLKRSEGLRRPFVTHFTGCSPCSGMHNPNYEGDSCVNQMERALNFADNQVLWTYGYTRRDLLDSKTITPLRFDYSG